MEQRSFRSAAGTLRDIRPEVWPTTSIGSGPESDGHRSHSSAFACRHSFLPAPGRQRPGSNTPANGRARMAFGAEQLQRCLLLPKTSRDRPRPISASACFEHRDFFRRVTWIGGKRLMTAEWIESFPASNHPSPETSLSPITPATMRTRQSTRIGATDSPSTAIPRAAVPAAPIPVQIA